MISSDLYLFSSANTPAIYSLPVSHSISKIPPSPSRCLLLYETARLGFRDGRVGHDSQDSDQSGMAHQRTGPMKRVSQPYDRGRALRAHDIGPAGEMPGALCGGDDGLSHSAQWHKARREGVDVMLSARNLPRPDKRPPDADSDERASTNGLLSAVCGGESRSPGPKGGVARLLKHMLDCEGRVAQVPFSRRRARE